MNEPTITIHGVEPEGRCCLSDQTGEVIVVSSPELNLDYARFRSPELTKLIKMSARQLQVNGEARRPSTVPMTDAGA